jgi:hypothetical protein
MEVRRVERRAREQRLAVKDAPAALEVAERARHRQAVERVEDVALRAKAIVLAPVAEPADVEHLHHDVIERTVGRAQAAAEHVGVRAAEALDERQPPVEPRRLAAGAAVAAVAGDGGVASGADERRAGHAITPRRSAPSTGRCRRR